MKKKMTLIFVLFALLAVGAALWQAWQAATLEKKLSEIDRRAQAQRLIELSLPRVQAELGRMLELERAKLGQEPPIGQAYYAVDGGERADFNCGFFMLEPAGEVQVPPGEEGFGQLLRQAPLLTNTIRRKAYNPSAPLYDPQEKTRFDPRTQMPVFGVYEVRDYDLEHPIRRTGKPGPFFAWHYKDNLVYMRSIPTTHGAVAEGFIIDAAKLATHLLPLVEPGLESASIGFAEAREVPNLSPLPLMLRPGSKVSLPDTAARREALRGPVISAWLISILSIIIVFALLAFYARLERRRSDFVSAVTHELRTPLTSFQLYTDMLRSGVLAPDKVHEYHDTLHRESLRLGHLVENVLAFAKLSRGKVRGRQDKGACAQLLAPLLEKTAEHLKKAGCGVSINIDPRASLLSLRTDLLSVEQILMNLADNAIKYTDAERPAISIHALQTHRTLSIRFSDNGSGIDADDKKKLFRPFTRTAKSDREQKPGIGLGLALARDLARSIGGNLALERSDARGTTFLLTLPLGE